MLFQHTRCSSSAIDAILRIASYQSASSRVSLMSSISRYQSTWYVRHESKNLICTSWMWASTDSHECRYAHNDMHANDMYAAHSDNHPGDVYIYMYIYVYIYMYICISQHTCRYDAHNDVYAAHSDNHLRYAHKDTLIRTCCSLW